MKSQAILLNSSMAIKRHTVFPNYLFEKQLILPEEVKESLLSERGEISKVGSTIETNFGWATNKEYPLGKEHQKLCKLVSHHFISECDNILPTKTNNVQVCNPYMLSISPGHSYNVNLEPMRWYNALFFLQTTDKGSHLYLNNFSEKLYAQQNTQESTFVVKPKTNKVVYFPSHLPWGMSANMSMIDTVVLCLTFRVAVKEPDPSRKN